VVTENENQPRNFFENLQTSGLQNYFKISDNESVVEQKERNTFKELPEKLILYPTYRQYLNRVLK